MPSKALGDLADYIKQTGEHRYEVTRGAMDRVLANQAELMRSARIVPEKNGDEVIGIRVFGIRSGTLLDHLGFKNGDRIEKLNGMSMASPDQALEAYAQMRNKDKHVVVLTRKGTALELVYVIVDDPERMSEPKKSDTKKEAGPKAPTTGRVTPPTLDER